MSRLAGKVAIVTGSGGPMGKAIAQRFVEAGASVAICDMSARRVDAAAKELRPKLAPGAKLYSERLNVKNDDEVYAYCDSVEASLGPVDILVNVVGGFRSPPLSHGPSQVFAPLCSSGATPRRDGLFIARFDAPLTLVLAQASSRNIIAAIPPHHHCSSSTMAMC